MNFKLDNATKLIERYLEQAKKRLASAEALLRIGNYEDSVSRSYYAILDAATACLIKKDVVPQSHTGAIKLFSLHYIKPGLVDRRYQRQFALIEKARIEADYTPLRSFTETETSDILSQARDFVKMAEMLTKEQ